MRAVLAAFVVCVSQAGSAAAQDLDVECAVQGDLVQQIVQKRLDGKNKRRAERQIRRDLTEAQARYDGVLAAMIDWVYLQLPEEQLSAEIGVSWEQQCLEAGAKAKSG